MASHVAERCRENVSVYSHEWFVMNFYDSMTRWAVPVFVMISGALFLSPSKNIPIRKFYGKYIFRIFTAFMFWSFVYAVMHYVDNRNAVKALGHFIIGHAHMWFLFMITGLYMIVPFVRKISESESLTKYFLAITFMYAFIMPEAARIVLLFSEEYGTFAYSLINNFYLYFVAGYTGYFLLGYSMNSVSISPRAGRVIFAAGVAGFAATVLMSSYASRFKGELFTFYGNNTVNVLCEAVALFVFFKMKLNYPSKMIRALSQYSFGAYLVHYAVIMITEKFGLNALTFSPVISIPVISVIVFVISFVVSAVLNHIPILKKYIV